MILFAVQFEQEVAQPTQVPLMLMNPLLQAMHRPVISQVMQFGGQGEQVLFIRI